MFEAFLKERKIYVARNKEQHGLTRRLFSYLETIKHLLQEKGITSPRKLGRNVLVVNPSKKKWNFEFNSFVTLRFFPIEHTPSECSEMGKMDFFRIFKFWNTMDLIWKAPITEKNSGLFIFATDFSNDICDNNCQFFIPWKHIKLLF
jgi:hypothetical protein